MSHRSLLQAVIALVLTASGAIAQNPAPGGAPPQTPEGAAAAPATTPPRRVAPRPYAQVVPARAHTERGAITAHRVDDRYLLEIADSILGRDYLLVSRIATAFWGLWAMVTAQQAKNMGSLVEAVNMLGSLFYGGLLGVFVLAIFFKRVGGTAAFIGVLVGEAAIFTANYLKLTSFLWFNVIGCVVVILTALSVTLIVGERRLVK